ncbi:MAG: hypothetical protein Q8M15_08830 [Bacteroidota bacterium]|nr:hypothetical protein [Bacteroidota bacterium]
MTVRNPYALYVNCDGAMDYDKVNSGGVGFVVSFPDNLALDDRLISIGKYEGGNIERIEYEAIIQAMLHVIDLFYELQDELANINQIIFISDRFALQDSERTNVYRIREWRRNNWHNHEGKPIKNHDLLDRLDKIRKKLTDYARARVNIEYRPRKQNKAADKLAKAGKKEGLVKDSLAKKGEKIGKRLFNGNEIKYTKLRAGLELHIHVFRKDPVQEQWEVWCEICEGENKGEKLKLYVDDILAAKLKRRNQFIIKIKSVYKYHIGIYKTLKNIEK